MSIFPLQKYKDSLGKPRTGVHTFRIPFLDVAFFDVAATLLAAKFLANSKSITYAQAVCILFIIGAFAHRLFAVNAVVLK